MANGSHTRTLTHFSWAAVPPLLLRWFVVVGVYAVVLILFFVLKAQGGNNPELLGVGPFHFRWYGALITSGVIIASFLAAYLAERYGENPEHVWKLLPVLLVSSLIVARLWFVVFTWPTYAAHPEKIIAIWEGGIAIQGGVLGGLLGGILYSHWAKISVWRWVDFIAPGLVLAQAIGRWGNFMNNEAYGRPTNLPWGIKIPCDYRTDGHPGTIDSRCNTAGYPGPDGTFHPTFLYESLWDYACFLVLLYLALHPNPTWIERKLGWKRREGDLFLVYWVIYSVGRFFTESLRTDSLTYGGLRTAQFTAVAAILICSVWLYWRHYHNNSSQNMGHITTAYTNISYAASTTSTNKEEAVSAKSSHDTSEPSSVSLDEQATLSVQTQEKAEKNRYDSRD